MRVGIAVARVVVLGAVVVKVGYKPFGVADGRYSIVDVEDGLRRLG